MDAWLWRWWAALERFAQEPGQVTVWTDAVRWPWVGPGHLHPNPTAVVCLSGVVRIAHPNGHLDLQAGDALLLDAGVWHEHEPLRPGAAWFGQGFLPSWSDVAVVEPERRWFGRLPVQPTRTLVEAAIAGPDHRAALRQWLAQFVKEPVEKGNWREPVLQPMVELMWRRGHVGVTVAELVKASGAARSTAYETFARWYGLPPKEMILASRLELAGALLRQGLAVAEVAHRCQFRSADTFTRCWRRAHGVAPSQWQRRPGLPLSGA